MRRSQVLVLPALALLIGCAAPPTATRFSPSPDDRVLIASASGISVYNPQRAKVEHHAVRGLPSPDLQQLFTLESQSDEQILKTLDPRSGSLLSEQRLSGTWQLRVASPSGNVVALGEPAPAGSTPYLPAARSHTRLVVATSDGSEPPLRFDLPGNFEPEAFSSNDRWLYLIEYLPAEAPTRYAVRQMKLSNGKVFPIGLRTKQPAPEEMRGTGRSQIYAPDRTQLYTLYTKQGVNLAHGKDVAQPHKKGDVHAFVHVLSLTGGWAHCVDLPKDFGRGDAPADGIAVSPDGHWLYVIDPSTGLVVEVDAWKLRVVNEQKIPLDYVDGERTLAQVGANGLVLYVARGSELLAIDTVSFEVLERWQMDDEISALALTPDAQYLLVGGADETSVIDTKTGAAVERITTPGVTRLDYVDG